jgi:hypothetical protein
LLLLDLCAFRVAEIVASGGALVVLVLVVVVLLLPALCAAFLRHALLAFASLAPAHRYRMGHQVRSQLRLN